MTNIITSFDFKDRFEIAQKIGDTAKLTSYITTYQDNYLRKLLGIELFDAWSADIDASPYDQITDPFTVVIGCEQFESKGVHEMLKGLIYYNYQKDALLVATASGNREVQTSNTKPISPIFIRDRYNEAIDTYKAIQAYCMDKADLFPEFKGLDLGYMIF